MEYIPARQVAMETLQQTVAHSEWPECWFAVREIKDAPYCAYAVFVKPNLAARGKALFCIWIDAEGLLDDLEAL